MGKEEDTVKDFLGAFGLGKSGPDDDIAQSEEVIVIVRPESKEPGPPPQNMVCRAVACDDQICWVAEPYDYWSVFCPAHQIEDETARLAGTPRVPRE